MDEKADGINSGMQFAPPPDRSDSLGWRILARVGQAMAFLVLLGFFVAAVNWRFGMTGPERHYSAAHALFSNSSPAEVKAPIIATAIPAPKEFTIEFDGLATDDNYDNFFQTSDDPHAIRMELQHPNQLYISLGYLVRPQLHSSFRLNEMHHFVIQGQEGKYIVVFLDGERVFFTDSKTLTAFNYHFDKVAVGSGCARERPLQGTVKNFTLAASADAPAPRARTLGADAILACLGLAMIGVLFPRVAWRSTRFAGRVGHEARVMMFCPRTPFATGMSQEAKIKVIGSIILVGFVSAVGFHYAAVHYYHLGYPWDSFLLTHGAPFSDFFHPVKDAAGRDPYAPAPTGGYAPFCYLLLYPLTLVNPLHAFVAFLGVSVGFLLYFNWQMLRGCGAWVRANGVFALTFLAYPVLMVLDRGNIDTLLFLLMALFLFAYQKGHYKTSAVFLAAASAMKIFPGLFVLLFIADRKYREALGACALILVLTVAGMGWLDGGVANSFVQYRAKLASQSADIASDDTGLHFNSSCFALIRLVFKVRSVASCLRLYEIYQWCSLGILAVLAAYVVRWERSLWRRVSLLTLAMVLLPAFNYDYRLIFLWLPLSLFLNESPGRFDSVYAVLFGLLLIPKAYFMIRDAISVSVILNPLLMIGLAGLNLYERWVIARQVSASEFAGEGALLGNTPLSLVRKAG